MGLWHDLNEIYEFRRAKQNALNSVAFRINKPLTKPENVTFLITHACNLTCHMCGCAEAGVNPQGGEGGGYIVGKRDEMTLDQFMRVVDDLADWGVRNLIFSGGEVLLRKQDTLELLKRAKHHGLFTTIVSNSLSWNEDLAKTFADAGLDNYTSSLDGFKPETHDKIRGRKGSHERVLRTLRWFEKLKESYPHLSTNTTTVVQRDNFRELVDVSHLLTDLGVGCIMYQAVSGDFPDLMMQGEAELEEFKAVLEELKVLRASGHPIWNSPSYFDTMPRYYVEKLQSGGKFYLGDCLAGFDNLIVSPNGTIDICGFGPYGVSLKDMSILDIWESQAYAEARERISKCDTQCMYLCYEKTDLKSLSNQVGGVVRNFMTDATHTVRHRLAS